MNNALDLVRQILRSEQFHAEPLEKKEQTLDAILATGEITVAQLLDLINEARQVQSKQPIKSVESLKTISYDNFKNLVNIGQLKGKDLISFCLSNPVINGYCNKVDSADEMTIFHRLLKKQFNIYLPPVSMSSKEVDVILAREKYLDYVYGGYEPWWCEYTVSANPDKTSMLNIVKYDKWHKILTINNLQVHEPAPFFNISLNEYNHTIQGYYTPYYVILLDINGKIDIGGLRSGSRFDSIPSMTSYFEIQFNQENDIPSLLELNVRVLIRKLSYTRFTPVLLDYDENVWVCTKNGNWVTINGDKKIVDLASDDDIFMLDDHGDIWLFGDNASYNFNSRFLLEEPLEGFMNLDNIILRKVPSNHKFKSIDIYIEHLMAIDTDNKLHVERYYDIPEGELYQYQIKYKNNNRTYYTELTIIDQIPPVLSATSIDGGYVALDINRVVHTINLNDKLQINTIPGSQNLNIKRVRGNLLISQAGNVKIMDDGEIYNPKEIKDTYGSLKWFTDIPDKVVDVFQVDRNFGESPIILRSH